MNYLIHVRLHYINFKLKNPLSGRTSHFSYRSQRKRKQSVGETIKLTNPERII